MRKGFLAGLLLLLFTVVISGCSGRNADFGFVDVQRVMQESPKVQELQTKMEEKGKELEAASTTEKSSLSKEEFEQRQQSRQAEFMAFGQDLEKQFKESMNKAMDQVAKEKKLGAVLVKGSVLHGGVDVTDEVIKLMK